MPGQCTGGRSRRIVRWKRVPGVGGPRPRRRCERPSPSSSPTSPAPPPWASGSTPRPSATSRPATSPPCAQPLERHGGTVEKYIGDAVMAVFGIPVLHEDDALRAVRAAIEMRDAMAELNRELEHDLGVGLELRIGVNTGEVAGADGQPAMASSPATPSTPPPASRRRRRPAASSSARRPGAWSRVRRGCDRTARSTLKGKARPRSDVGGGGAGRAATGRCTRRSAVPLVGRRAELRMLNTRFRRAVDRDRCVLVTVTRPGGDRQVAAPQGVHRRHRDGGDGRRRPLPAVRRGHHLLAADRDRERPRRRHRRGRDRGSPRGRLPAAGRGVARRGRGRTSRGERDRGGRPVGGAAAVRGARPARPLVVVFDDIHWAEPAMLDLIEHVAAHATGRRADRLPRPRRPARAAPGVGDARVGGAASSGSSRSPTPTRPACSAAWPTPAARQGAARRGDVRGGGQPALPRTARRDARRRPGRADSSDDPGAPRRAHRRAPGARTASDRGRVDRGPRIPPRSRAGARRPEADASTPRSPRWWIAS